MDYETFRSAIPRFVGYRPFNQIPFQFSLHVFNQGETEPIHAEFIFTENKNPDEAIINALKNICQARALFWFGIRHLKWEEIGNSHNATQNIKHF